MFGQLNRSISDWAHRYFTHIATWIGCISLIAHALLVPWAASAALVTLNHQPEAPKAKAEAKQIAAKKLAQLPVRFERNEGQYDALVKYSARSDGFTLALLADEARLTLRKNKDTTAQVKMSLVNGNRHATLSPLQAAPGVTHYYTSRDASKWVRNVKSYERVQYDEVYPGIDLVWYGQGRELEYDFVVAPGANPQLIAWQFAGAESLGLDAAGNLLIKTSAGELAQHAPVIYQMIEGVRREIAGRFVITSHQRVSFSLGEYDRTQTLVIDPRIGYSSYVGGIFDEHVTTGVAVTRAGEAYVGGFTFSGSILGTDSDSRIELFITKLNAQGSAAIFTVFLGSSATEHQALITALAVDGSDSVYATGRTRTDFLGGDFPLVNAFQEKSNPGFAGTSTEFKLASDAFVTKLDADGEIVYSTLLGGARDDQAFDIAVTSEGRAAITGYTSSRNFPTQHKFQGNVLFFSGRDIFVSVFEADGRSLQYSTYLRSGDINDEEGRGIGVDNNGRVYVVGFTEGNRLPTRAATGQPFQPERADGRDAFLAKFDPFAEGEASLVYATYLGGAGTDEASDVAIDSAFNAYVTGITGSANFPLQAAVGGSFFDNVNQINDAFVTIFNPTATGLLFSTFLGGNGLETNPTVEFPNESEELTLRGTGRIALDGQSNIYVTGTTASTDFFTLHAVQPRLAGAQDLFVTKLTPGGRAVVYSTYWGGTQREFPGGLAIDTNQNVFISGHTASQDLLTTPGAAQETFGGRTDTFITKLGNPNADTIGAYDPATSHFFLRNSNTVGLPDLNNILFGQTGDLPIVGDWDGDGVETVGVFRQGTYLLSNSNVSPVIDLTLPVGVTGDLPVVGDWDGDGDDTVGVQRGNLFFLTNDNATFTTIFFFGLVGDIALAGDWDGDGIDTIGVFRQGTFFLSNNATGATVDFTVNFGAANALPVVGDWDGNGSTTIGVLQRASRNNVFLLRNSNSTGNADITLSFSRFSIPSNPFGGGGILPLAGDYDGLP